MLAALHAELAGLGLGGLALVLDEAEAGARDEAPGVSVRLTVALRLALEAFTSGVPGPGPKWLETPLSIVRDAPDAYGLPTEPSPEQIGATIRSWLTDDPGARVVLLTPATLAMDPYRFPPEQGEDPAALWVFRVVTPGAYPGLWWAIVDPAGGAAPYAYGYA